MATFWLANSVRTEREGGITAIKASIRSICQVQVRGCLGLPNKERVQTDNTRHQSLELMDILKVKLRPAQRLARRRLTSHRWEDLRKLWGLLVQSRKPRLKPIGEDRDPSLLGRGSLRARWKRLPRRGQSRASRMELSASRASHNETLISTWWRLILCSKRTSSS